MNYERSAPYYDLFGAEDDGDFLAGLAARCGGPALVAAAGTAREAFVLADAGVDVVAFDASPAMLTVAAGAGLMPDGLYSDFAGAPLRAGDGHAVFVFK